VKGDVNHFRTQRSQRSSKCYFRQMASCCHQRARIGKAVWSWKKCL